MELHRTILDACIGGILASHSGSQFAYSDASSNASWCILQTGNSGHDPLRISAMADFTVLAIQTFVVVPSVFDDSPLLQSAISSR